MVTTVDIYELQLLFNNPEPFISAAVQRGMSSRYTGYNLGARTPRCPPVAPHPHHCTCCKLPTLALTPLSGRMCRL